MAKADGAAQWLAHLKACQQCREAMSSARLCNVGKALIQGAAKGGA